ncbi:methyltransferase domain-containing protein [Streptacidiphilus sp. N1-12]|uniref:Methyltransferase domain-containing protein n=2 Tax=Streptacidiphilus alkalitolerans TaxID=3342712 RepID=A0ABV6VL05_9ACTN
MLQDIVEYLACPHCGLGLTTAQDGRALRCATRHSFDVARQGYASLLPGDAHTGTGDTAAMVAAREAFLGAGHYAPIVAALAAAAPAGAGADCVVDLGAGTGHYLAAVLDALPKAHGIALDISKFALRRAARAHPRAGAVVCDAWRPLPLRDGAADLVLNVFAPRNGPEIRRVLRPGGTLLVVSPTPRHLAELVGDLGLLGVDDRKEQRLAATLGPYLESAGSSEHSFPMLLDHAAVRTVVGMGPSAWHTDPDALAERMAALPDPVPVTASVTLTAFTR